jgi:hypothetical protein
MQRYFNQDFMGSGAPDLVLIKSLINFDAVNIYDPDFQKQAYQSPSCVVDYVDIPINGNSTIAAAEGGGTLFTFYPQTGLGHLESMFMSITPSVTGANATPCELWPYLFFTEFSILYNKEIFVNQINIEWMLAHKFATQNNNKRDQLLRLASDVTPWVVGVAHDPSVIVFPTPWDPLFNNTGNAPLPIRVLQNQLTIQFKTRAYEEWLPVYTVGVTKVNLSIVLVGKTIDFYGSSAETPGIGHSDKWICAYEDLIVGEPSGYNMLANTPQNIKTTGLDGVRSKALNFYFQKLTDYPNPVVPNVGTRNFLRGGFPTTVSYYPQAKVAWTNLNTYGLLKLSMLSSWDKLEWYNTVNSTITNTWENNYLFTFDGHYDIDSVLGSYVYQTKDATYFRVTYPYAGTLYLTSVCFAIMGIRFDNASKTEGSLVRLYGYGGN